MACPIWFLGRSSAESTLVLEQMRDNQWHKVTEATFVMVARDPLNTCGAILNPLIAETEEEKALFALGEKNKILRKEHAKDSLFKNPPTEHEKMLIHDFFIQVTKNTFI